MNSTTSETSPLDIVAAILEQENLDCVVLEEGVALKTAMSIDDDISWGSTIEIAPLSEEIQALVVFSRPPEPLPEVGHLVDTLKLINRINANLMAVGNFEIDLDGDLTLRTGLIFEQPSELCAENIAHTLFINWTEMGRYLPMILDVAHGRLELDACWEELTEG